MTLDEAEDRIRKRAYVVRVYKAKDGWRWRMRAGNGRIVADSGEAYVSRAGADRAALALVHATLVLGTQAWPPRGAR